MMTMPSDIYFLITFFDSCPGSLHVGTAGGRNLFYRTIFYFILHIFEACRNQVGWERVNTLASNFSLPV
jgi:hypothetical protein